MGDWQDRHMNRQGSLRMETEMEIPVEMPANTRRGADKESAVVLYIMPMENGCCHQSRWVHIPDVTTLNYASLMLFLHGGNMNPLSPVPWGPYPGLTVS